MFTFMELLCECTEMFTGPAEDPRATGVPVLAASSPFCALWTPAYAKMIRLSWLG
jgi:hypothetical protein